MSFTQDWLWDEPTAYNFGRENLGFLLTRAAGAYWAHYADGVLEQINPKEGFPRPDPDTADRTKRVVVPPTLRDETAGGYANYREGSKYTGQMRRVVQCRHSRGIESIFDYRWSRTHGILEWPRPRKIGTTKGQESVNFKNRRFWLIEISAAGVYAAPIEFGLNCLPCARGISRYQPTLGADVDLVWAYSNVHPAVVQRLLTAEQMAPAYAYTPWYSGMGWAFSWSGHAASNVVKRTVDDGFQGNAVQDYYETRLVNLTFSVTFQSEACTIDLISPGVARVSRNNHGIAEGKLAVISGCDDSRYNGAQVAFNVTADTFDYAVSGTPSSPATGNPQVANGAANATLGGTLVVGTPGRVTFRPNDLGTMWVPKEGEYKWVGVKPFFNILNNQGGPVHVFYDGEDQVVTNWGITSTFVAESSALDGNSPFPDFGPNILPPYSGLWNGVNSSGTHVSTLPTPEYSPTICYQFWNHNASVDGNPCSIKSFPVWFGYGHFTGQHTKLNWGFSGPFDAQVEAYTRSHLTSKTEQVSALIDGYKYSYNDRAYLCSACGGNGERYPISWSYWGRYAYVDKTRVDKSESKRGESVLILFPTEREAVAGIKIQSESYTGTQRVSHFTHNLKRAQATSSAPFGPPYVEVWAVAPISSRVQTPGHTNLPIPDDVTNISGETKTGTFFLRASAGINQSFSMTDISQSGDLAPFLVYQQGVKEEAVSGLFFMRGGIEYTDPALVPVDQTKNFVRRIDGSLLTKEGFTGLTGKSPVAFIGQV